MPSVLVMHLKPKNKSSPDFSELIVLAGILPHAHAALKVMVLTAMADNRAMSFMVYKFSGAWYTDGQTWYTAFFSDGIQSPSCIPCGGALYGYSLHFTPADKRKALENQDFLYFTALN